MTSPKRVKQIDFWSSKVQDSMMPRRKRVVPNPLPLPFHRFILRVLYKHDTFRKKLVFLSCYLEIDACPQPCNTYIYIMFLNRSFKTYWKKHLKELPINKYIVTIKYILPFLTHTTQLSPFSTDKKHTIQLSIVHTSFIFCSSHYLV